MVYDLAIVGSGGGAFAAAIAARRKGKSVVMVERATTGGTCVNTGCVPSKALLAAAEARHTAAAHPFPGIGAAALGVDFPALIGGKRQLVEGLRADKYVDLAAEYGWDIVHGEARFSDGPVLEVDRAAGGTERVEAEHYVVATGSAPWAPPIDGLADAGYLTSTTAMATRDAALLADRRRRQLCRPGAGPAVRPARHARHRGRGPRPARPGGRNRRSPR